MLEDISLDARIDSRGRLVATTNVRRIADNLGMSKNAVTKHLARLRDHGFLLHEEQRRAGSGRYLDVLIHPGPVGLHRAVHRHAARSAA